MRKRDPMYLKKNLGNPLTLEEHIEKSKLINEGKLEGFIYKRGNNYYFINKKANDNKKA